MQIYYFTRTGRSKQIAETLAARYETEARHITDGENWRGPMGFLRGGASSAKRQDLPASYPPTTEGEPIVLVFPIWAGGFPPAIRNFLEREGRGRVIAVPTSLSSVLKDRDGFVRVIDLVGKTIDAPAQLD